MVEVKSLTHYFSVPEVYYIRMLYNRTSISIKSSLYPPPFDLPTIGFTLQTVKRGTFMVDHDIGEMFPKFIVSEEVRYFCGMDVKN